MFVDNIENCSGNLESSSMPAQVGDTFCNLWSRGVLHHKFNRLNMSQSKMVIQKEVHTQYSLCLEIRAAFNATAARPKPSRATKLANLRANGFENSVGLDKVSHNLVRILSILLRIWYYMTRFLQGNLIALSARKLRYIEFSILGKF